MEPLDGPPSAQPVRWVSSEDWTKHQSLLMRLYEEYPLKKVKKFMEDDHSFKATWVAFI